MLLSNLKELKSDMVNKDWTICSFIFRYKTKLLRGSLFEYFRNESNISFCYYADPAMENDDATILRNFSK